MYRYLKIGLKGFGQIMLQDSFFTGVFFIAGIFYGSLQMGIAAVLAVAVSIITARILNLEYDNLERGLYGFSAALVGVAVLLFLKSSIVTWMIVVIGSVATTLLQHFFIKRSFPAFTFPFVLITWIVLFVTTCFFPDLKNQAMPDNSDILNPFAFVITGFGQVIFQEKFISGLLFFMGVLVSSPIAALYAIAAAGFTGMISFWLNAPPEGIEMGLYSFNAVLCAILFAGRDLKDLLWVFISVLISLIITFVMFRMGLPQLTFPFVLASWITLFVKNFLNSLFPI